MTVLICCLFVATAAKTSVLMLPGPMAFTRTLTGASASAIALRGAMHRVAFHQLPSANSSLRRALPSYVPLPFS